MTAAPTSPPPDTDQLPPPRMRWAYRLLLVGGLALLAAGWFWLGGGDSGSRRDGGHYVEGVVGDLGRINPLFVTRDTPAADVSQLVFSGLTRLGPDGTPLPDLASRWEVTPDGQTYTFHLRPGLSWHDGRTLTSADVAFTVQQVQVAGFQGPARLSAAWSGVQVLTPDARTVIFRLPTRSATFLATATLGIVPEHLLRGLGVGELLLAPFNAAPIGSGPYRFISADGRGVRLARNPAYHRGAPSIDTIELRIFPDHEALAAALRRGEIDGALLRDAAATPAAVAAIGGTGPGGARPAVPLTESGYTALYINNQIELLADPDLRRALVQTIDRPALLGTAALSALPGDGPFVPGSWAAPTDGDPAPPSPAAVDSAFAAAGWFRDGDGLRRKGGDPLTLSLLADESRAQVAQRVAEMLLDQGVLVDLRVLPGTVLLRDHIQPRAFQLLVFGWTTGLDPDPFGGWHTSQIARGGGNISGFHDPAADRLLERARLTLDTAERVEIYAEFDARFRSLAPAAILYYPQARYVLPRAIEGELPTVLVRPAMRFSEVHTWRLG